MALTHVTAIRNSLCNLVVDAVDAGTTDANGDLVILASNGTTVVATLAFSATAFGAASSGTATADTITADSSAVGGTAALFKVQDKDNAEVFRGTVTGSGGGGDIIISNTTVAAADTVSCSTLTYSASL